MRRKTMTILSRTEQTGRSMVEMLGVLAIIGVLSVGGISGYSKAMAKYKLTKAQDQITMLLMNIRTAYATSPSYSGLTTAAVAAYNIAPGEMIVGDATIGDAGTTGTVTLNGAFGGAVNVASLGTRDSYFYIQMRALAPEACRSLASSDWGADGLVMMSVGADAEVTLDDAAVDETCETADDNFCAGDLPLGLATAASQCNHSLNQITWVYY